MTCHVMVQGAGSNVGKSLLTAGLARAFARRGLSVFPFKPQNMSNNAAVTVDGGEIGRAQALQALAAGCEPLIDMNPVLLKPETENGAQVILQGKRIATLKGADYTKMKATLLPAVLESYHRLAAQADIMLVEGAGSPAEINLRAGDIANMGFAEAAGLPVILVGDIDRGGVIAQLVGTNAVLSKADSTRIKGFLINKFRGDPTLFKQGYEAIEARTGWQGLGICPWFDEAASLPAEDALDLTASPSKGQIKIGCLRLNRIANFDDLDPLKLEPDVALQMIAPGQALPGDLDLVIIPGSKSTIHDLALLRAEGWDIDLCAHLRRNGHILGLCGGYQMLGQMIDDPAGIEGPAGKVQGLSLLNIQTRLTAQKRVSRVHATHCASGTEIAGYEIHIGRTEGPDCASPFAKIDKIAEGAISADGRVMGTYLHGIFASDSFRRAFLKNLGATPSHLIYNQKCTQILDRLADHITQHCDLDAIYAIASGKAS